MFRFTTRDVLWLTVVVALCITLAMQKREAINARKRITAELNRFTNINFVQMPLADSVQYISVQHRVPILFADGIDEDTPVTATFNGVPLRTALDGMLPPLGLEYRVKDGWIVIESSRH